jgi:hypothetical protein
LAALDARALEPFSAAGWSRAGFESPEWCLAWPGDPATTRPLAAGALPDVPVLVLSGELDTNTPTSAGRAAAAQYPRATVVEIPNAGHTPAENTPCATAVARRFVRTLTAAPDACGDAGAPPPAVAARAPVRAAQVTPVAGAGTRAQRRALGVVVATIADLQEQALVYGSWGAARALRGGLYRVGRDGRVRLANVRVVRDARVSGAVAVGAENVRGMVRLAGAGVLDGRLTVRLAATGRGRATGRLGGVRVDLRFGGS